MLVAAALPRPRRAASRMSRPTADRGGATAPAPRRRIGLELEFPVVARATGRGMDRGTAARLWPAFVARNPGWSLARERVTGVTLGVTRPNGAFVDQVDTDTGICTVELSLAPAETIGRAVAGAHAILRDLHRLLDPLGHTVLGAGIQPHTWFDAARKTRKDWYLLLARRWHYHHWFVPIASHQVAVDVAPDEAARAVNVLSGFAGVFTALTAGSPIARGRIQPWKETRNWVWHERSGKVSAEEARYTSNGIPPAPYADVGAYLEHFWASRLYFLTDGKTSGCEVLGGRSFRDFLMSPEPVPARRVDGERIMIAPDRQMLDRIHQYGWPAAKLHYGFDARTDLDDVRTALTRGRLGPYFEEHAVRCYVENRTSGVAPPGEEGVAAALTLGLVERLDDAEALLHKVAWDDWRALWVRASAHGLAAEDADALARIRELLELAADGLRARGAGEETFLAPLFTRLDRRETPADRMLAAFRAGGVPRLLDAFGHTPDATAP
ncbi:glutamate-cysteine ligase family protein [Streptomyces noursei]|uniref:glutamate-cysteine ligase family protein n=1 Tax=Streptomyces noursei TaxID=1971 RepID=UPI0011DE097F|nr:glutamate-cysteine ligase family protein [Streptomyces noursei]